MTLLGKFDEPFDEETARFYFAEILLAVDSVHQLGYVHRDVKPDNMLIDSDGHVRLADFGSCKYVGKDQRIASQVAVGTPDYISPEVLQSVENKGSYGKEADYWSCGVILYELLFGDTPFYAESLIGTYSNIMSYEKTLTFPEDIPISATAKDLISRLCTSAEKRLGLHGVEEIFAHPFFAGFDPSDLRSRKPPFVPEIKGRDDASNFDEIDPDLPEVLTTLEPKRTNAFSGHHLPFVGFSYFRFSKDSLGGLAPTDATSTVPASSPPKADVLVAGETRKELDQLERRCEQLILEKDSVNRQLADLRKTLREFEDRLDTAELRGSDLADQLADKTRELVDVRSAASEALALRVALDEKDATLQEALAKLAELEELNFDLENRQKSDERALQLARDDVLHEQQQRRNLEMILSGIDAEIAETRRRLHLDAIESGVDMQNGESDTHIDLDPMRYRTTISALEATKAALEKSLIEVREESNQARTALFEEQKRRVALENEVRSFSFDQSESKSLVHKLEADLQTAREAVRAREAELLTVRSQLAQSEESGRQIERLKHEVDLALAVATESISSADSRAAEFASKLDARDREMAALQTKLESSLEMAQELRDDMRTQLDAMRLKLQDEAQDKVQLRREKTGLIDELAIVRRELRLEQQRRQEAFAASEQLETSLVAYRRRSASAMLDPISPSHPFSPSKRAERVAASATRLAELERSLMLVSGARDLAQSRMQEMARDNVRLRQALERVGATLSPPTPIVDVSGDFDLVKSTNNAEDGGAAAKVPAPADESPKDPSMTSDEEIVQRLLALQSSLNERTEQIHDLTRQLRDSESARDAAEAEKLAALDQVDQRMRTMTDEYERRMADISDELKRAKFANRRLKRKSSVLEVQSGNTAYSLRNTAQSVEELTRGMKLLELRLQDANERTEELQQSSELLQRQNGSLKTGLESANATIRDLQNILDRETDAHDSLATARASLAEHVASLSNRVAEAEMHVAEREAELRALRSDLEKAVAVTKEKEVALSHAEAELERLRKDASGPAGVGLTAPRASVVPALPQAGRRLSTYARPASEEQDSEALLRKINGLESMLALRNLNELELNKTIADQKNEVARLQREVDRLESEIRDTHQRFQLARKSRFSVLLQARGSRSAGAQEFVSPFDAVRTRSPMDTPPSSADDLRSARSEDGLVHGTQSPNGSPRASPALAVRCCSRVYLREKLTSCFIIAAVVASA